MRCSYRNSLHSIYYTTLHLHTPYTRKRERESGKKGTKPNTASTQYHTPTYIHYYTSTSTLPAMGASPLFGVAVDASTQSSKIKDGTYVNSLEYNGKESVSRFGFEME